MNSKALRNRMKEKGISVVEIVRELGISRSAFWKKCNGRSEFKLGEIKKIAQILDVENAADIFFS